MCGIHGLINKSTIVRVGYERFIEDGFVVNSVRGMDSSGVFQIDSVNRPFLHKQTLPGPIFVDTKQAKAYFRDAQNSPLTVCHVRAATAGKISVDNAHPFVVPVGTDGKRIIGVHNGTLTSWRQKAEANKYDVDSEWALSHIGRKGIDAFEDFDGAFVFVWWNENDKNTVHFARNKERPLHFLLTKDKTAMMFASEPGMIAWLAQRNGIETDSTIYSLEEGMHYQFDYSGKEITWTKEKLPTYKYPTYSGSGNWNQRQSGSATQGASCGLRPEAGDAEWDDYAANGWYGARGSRGQAADSFPPAAKKIVEDTRAFLRANRAERYKTRNEADPEAVVIDGEVIDAKTGGKPEQGRPKSRSSDAAKPALSAKAARREKRKQRKQLKLKPKAERQAAPRAAAARSATQDDAVGALDWVEAYKQDYIVPDAWYSAKSATVQERQAAKTIGVMGELQWFQGAFFEPSTGELYGDIQYYEKGVGKVTAPAVLRNMTARVASEKYTNNKENGGWIVVCGAYHDQQMKAKTYVVAELNDVGRAGLKAMAA